MSRGTILFLAALLTSITWGCAQRSAEPGTVTRDGDLVSGTGTVRFVELEGGFYAIEGDDQQSYDPTDLPADFRTEGLRVRFTAKLRPDLASIHMAGPIVEILKIERL
jgi:hypothetical protein